MNKNEFTAWAFFAAPIILWLAAIAGWVLNLVKVTIYFGGEWTGMEVARVAGIFLAPVGAVLGWF